MNELKEWKVAYDRRLYYVSYCTRYCRFVIEIRLFSVVLSVKPITTLCAHSPWLCVRFNIL